MNRSILSVLCGLTMGIFPVVSQSQLYVVKSASGSQTESWLDANGERTTPGSPHITWNETLLKAAYQAVYLNEPFHRSYNMEWLDGAHTLQFPPSCEDAVDKPNWGAAVDAYLLLNGSMVSKVVSQLVESGPLNGVVLKYNRDPVNKTGNQTSVVLNVPGTISCNSGLGEFNATVTGYSNAQKWWDGGKPNWRRTTQKLTVTYVPLVTVSAEFSPQTISMTGPVNTYIENSAYLIVTTSGGANVTIEWPEVNSVEYEQAGAWVKGHNQIVPVTDGANKINKRIRVRSSKAGSTTISVPVTMTVR